MHLAKKIGIELLTLYKNIQKRKIRSLSEKRLIELQALNYAPSISIIRRLHPWMSSIDSIHGWKSHSWMTSTDNTFIHG